MSERVARRERVAELGRLAETDPATLEAHVDDMTDYLDADSAYVRRRTTRAAAALASVRPAAAVALVDGLTDRLADSSDPDAAVALQRVAAEDPDAVLSHLAAIVTVLDDEGPVVVAASGTLAALAGADAEALAQPGVLDRLFCLLNDDRSAVRRNAAVALAAIAEVDPAAVCAGADDLPLDDDAPAVRRATAVALGTAGSACPDAVVDAAPGLVALLDDADPGVRAGAAFALGHALRGADVSQRTVDALLGALDDPSDEVRQHATFGLAALAGAEPAAVRPGVDALARRLVDASSPVRRNARSALAALEADYTAVVSEAVEDVLTRLEDVDGDTGTLGFTEAELRGLAGDGAAPAKQRAAADHALSLVGSGDVEAATETESPGNAGDDDGADESEDDASEETLFCPNCGESIDAGGEFCPVCGTTVESVTHD
jgi:HEAT repeat protein